jgi:DNA-directed RNA polymerase specialized sigma subunit
MEAMIANLATPGFLTARTPGADTEAIVALANAVQALPTLERLVMSLYYEQGLRVHEIAVVLELGELEVAHIYAQAFAALREEMRPAQRQAA